MSSYGKFSPVSAVVCLLTYPERCSLFPRAYSLPTWEQRTPAFPCVSSPFWLALFPCGLLLLAARIAAVDFSQVILAGLPGLQPNLVQPVAGEEGAQNLGCSHGPRNWVEGAGQQDNMMNAQHRAKSLMHLQICSIQLGQGLGILFTVSFAPELSLAFLHWDHLSSGSMSHLGSSIESRYSPPPSCGLLVNSPASTLSDWPCPSTEHTGPSVSFPTTLSQGRS